MRGIHPGESDLRVPVNSGHNVAFLALPMPHDRVDAQEESRDRLPLQFGDLFARTSANTFPIDPGLFCRFVIQA